MALSEFNNAALELPDPGIYKSSPNDIWIHQKGAALFWVLVARDELPPASVMPVILLAGCFPAAS